MFRWHGTPFIGNTSITNPESSFSKTPFIYRPTAINQLPLSDSGHVVYWDLWMNQPLDERVSRSFQREPGSLWTSPGRGKSQVSTSGIRGADLRVPEPGEDDVEDLRLDVQKDVARLVPQQRVVPPRLQHIDSRGRHDRPSSRCMPF